MYASCGLRVPETRDVADVDLMMSSLLRLQNPQESFTSPKFILEAQVHLQLAYSKRGCGYERNEGKIAVEFDPAVRQGVYAEVPVMYDEVHDSAFQNVYTSDTRRSLGITNMRVPLPVILPHRGHAKVVYAFMPVQRPAPNSRFKFG